MTNKTTENHSIPVRLTDLLHFKSLSNPSLSLDGTRAAFMTHQCSRTQDGYDSNLWIYDLSRIKNRFSAGHRTARFSMPRPTPKPTLLK